MSFDSWAKMRKIQRNLSEDRDYLRTVLEESPADALELIEREDDPSTLEAKLYLSDFMEKMSGEKDEDKKPFYRTLERINKGNLPDESVLKSVSSLFTKLVIEQEKSEVPSSAFEYVLEWQQRCLEDGEFNEVAIEACDLL